MKFFLFRETDSLDEESWNQYREAYLSQLYSRSIPSQDRTWKIERILFTSKFHLFCGPF